MTSGRRKRTTDEAGAVETSAVSTIKKTLGNPHWPSILDRTCRATGTKLPEVGEHILAQVGECFVENRTADAADRLFRAVLSLEEMAPANLTEAMLAGHMLTANSAAQRFLSLSLVEGQPTECVDRLVSRARRLMRVFMEQTELMQRLKGKTGQQRVVVEHVNVHQGGQAIVGAVMGVKGERANAHVREHPMSNGRGWLKNGNPPGDLSKIARCGAKNKRGTPCGGAAMKNGRCRLHGGLSTGARTPEGLERIRRAKTIHGRYSKAAQHEARTFRALYQSFRKVLKEIQELQ